MKKILLLNLLLITVVTVTSCKKNEKKDVKSTEKGYTVDSKATTINWTAYKTSDKVPVKGKFTDLIIEGNQKATSVVKAMDGLNFRIPINSLFTKDTIRDAKLKKFFFGAMENTALISGTVHMKNETSGTVELTMNAITYTLPVNITIENETVQIGAVLNLDNWKAQAALEALNEACKELHTGPDGETKTWSEVKINVNTKLNPE